MKLDEYLRVGDASEPPLQASKWLSVQMLIDRPEMENLLQTLGDFNIFIVGTVCQIGKGYIPKDEFLHLYGIYLDCLKSGTLPDESRFRAHFSSVLTVANDCLFRVLLENNRQVIRVAKPVVQLQLHKMDYSQADGKFRPMVFGQDSIYWGIQFSYPQLYQDHITKEVFQISDSPQFPNTALFRSIQSWMRKHTIPTPLVVDNMRINVPMRIGRECLSWIQSHPQLQKKGISIAAL